MQSAAVCTAVLPLQENNKGKQICCFCLLTKEKPNVLICVFCFGWNNIVTELIDLILKIAIVVNVVVFVIVIVVYMHCKKMLKLKLLYYLSVLLIINVHH